MEPYRLTVGPDDAIYFSDNTHGAIRRLVESGPGNTITAVQGDRQTVAVNTPIAEPLAVALRDEAGRVLANSPVTFTATADVQFLAVDARTNAQGVATARLLATRAGTATVRAAAQDSGETVFTLTVTPAASPLPVFAAGSVYGAGLTVNALAPLGLGSVFGAEFTADGVSRESAKDDLVDGRLPLVSAGVCVEIGSVRAPLLSVSASRIDFQTPLVPAGTAVLFQVVRDCGGVAETRSAPVRVTVQRVSPELRRWSDTAAAMAMDAATGAPVGPASLGEEYKPARPGQRLLLGAFGLGVTDPPLAAGEIPSTEAAVVSAVNVLVGGQTLTGQARLVAGSAGVYVVEFTLPDLASGDHPVRVSADGVASPAGATLTVITE
jgi:uncharacterized protein (TIGR03437 family)